MFKTSFAIAALIALPSISSALTVNAINDYDDALSNVDVTQSLALPGTWLDAPLTVAPDASLNNQYRSPFDAAGHTSAGYFAVGNDTNGTDPYDGTANPAILALSGLSSSISLLWGSPDSYNTLELYKGDNFVGSISGAEFNIVAREASFVTITADDASEYFDTVWFSSGNQNRGINAFEFSNITAVSQVPLPASGLLLIGGLGALAARSRRKSKNG
ncbi:VPLPA-CTERM sorting domain-containing protein [Rhodobacteraceae bacterium F11138]|nr:VPLPA-CTERM sorting domain-containing protein [Rhodobacteraceae bacterium F11138]